MSHAAGHPVPNELRELVLKFFTEKELVKLERLGGRVLISLTAPYATKERRNRKKIDIGDDLIMKLRDLRDSPNQLAELLDALSVKQLRALGKLLSQPLRTKSPRQELISELVGHFHSEEVWRRISQVSPSTTGE